MDNFPSCLQPFGSLSESARNLAVEAAIIQGELSPHLLTFLPVKIRHGSLTATIYVSPDYIGVMGSDGHFRTPLPAVSLQRIADHFGASLPTARMVDGIYHSDGAVRISFNGYSPTRGESRDSTRLWIASNVSIEKKLAGRTGLVAGHKKDVVVGPTQVARPDKVAIFGAWGSDGKIIQGLNVKDHYLGYSDYSQCGRLIYPVVTIDGSDWDMADVFRHPTYRELLTGEGPMPNMPRYKTA